MKRLTKVFKGGQKGFTLIELLIVIVILGVLAAAIIPNLAKFLGSGNVGAANAELASVRTGIAAYMADNNGALPTLDTAAPYDVENSMIDDFITGSSTIAAVYTCTVSGVIDGVSDEGTWADKGVTFDTISLLWEKYVAP